MNKLSKKITFSEKIKFLFDFLSTALFSNSLNDLDLTKVPDNKTIKKITKEFKKRYPTIYHVLVLERNKVMTKNLNNLMNNHPQDKILAIVGAGHEEGMTKLLKNER